MKKHKIFSLKISESNHSLVKIKINKMDAVLILDTGASNSCINIKKANYFKINYKVSKEYAYSATEKIRKIYISENNIEIEEFVYPEIKFLLFDMTQLEKIIFLDEKTINVDGILGADILMKTNAIIDYEKKYLKLEF